jgi:hypothetical protein
MKKLIATVLGSVACLLMLSIQPVCAAEPNALRIGVAKVDITPTKLTNLDPMGYGSFAGVHDPLFARALIIDNGSNTVALVALDLIETDDTLQVRERIQKELGIPVNHIIITASHSHSAPKIGKPTMGALTKHSVPEVDVYTNSVNDKIVAALKQATASLQPARLGIGTGSADVNVSRDLFTPQGWKAGFSPNGPSDKTVWVLKFETPSGEPIAVLFNYAVHPVVTIGDKFVSGDLAGAAEHFVEQHYSDKVVALWTLGPAGDQIPRFSGEPARNNERSISSFDAMNAQAFMLGAEVVRVANLIQPTISAAKVAADERVFLCPLREGIKQLGTFQTGGMTKDQVTSVPIRLGLIMIDQIALATVSGEVVTNIYSHLKKASPLTNMIMVTLANDRTGYFVDDATYDTSNFEVMATPAARGCAESGIVNGLMELIRAQF